MNRLISALSSCCLCCLTVLVFAATTAQAGTVCICHHPPGNPGNAHTICIGAPAVRAHLRHGDTLGECPVPCDSGDDCRAGQFCKRAEGVCAENASGICTNRPATCPATIETVCGCDGTTYDNACLAAAAGATVSHTGACEVAGACGGASGVVCGEGQFCKHEDGACAADAHGVCTDFPAVCPPISAPVCGCDGETYSSRCYAEGVGVTIATEGACQEGTACGGSGGGSCEGGSFCKPADGDCTTNAPGTCTHVPAVCSLVYDPVCGCDGVTYDNACNAHGASVGISHTGLCEADQHACGGTGGGTCGAGEFCSRPEGECGADAAGICERSPGSCPSTLARVCGCDGTTYSNKCVADGVGVTVDHDGPCVPSLACGGDSEQTCPSPLFCKRAVGACGANAPGSCAIKPVVCPLVVIEVCGCDGTNYANACYANGAGVTVNHEGACTTAR